MIPEKGVKPALGSCGDSARVEEEKPESRAVFGLEIERIARATAEVYGKPLEELKRKRRGEVNEARSMAMYLCQTLGGHKHSEKRAKGRLAPLLLTVRIASRSGGAPSSTGR